MPWIPPAESPHCLQAETLLALSGETAAEPRMVVPPEHLDGHALPRMAGKPIYGTPYSVHFESENFTVNALTPLSDPDLPEVAAGFLETAWQAFLDEQGWRAPVSSNQYLLWVLLDDGLGSATGYTTVYFTDEFPEGYPVIYLNPTWGSDPTFFASLAAHEFMHAIQYSLRDYGSGAASESWYWEASAMWAEELGMPDNDAYGWQSQWYTLDAGARYDSTENYHQYGMFVLNSWLEEGILGEGGMRSVWEASEGLPGEDWVSILETVAETPAEDIWGGFSGAMGNALLRESRLYAKVEEKGDVIEGEGGTVDLLGTDYWNSPSGGYLVVETDDGAATLSGPAGWEIPLYVNSGDIVAVTSSTGDGLAYRLRWTEPPDSPMDSAPLDSDDGPTPPRSKDSSCGCRAGYPQVGWFPLLLGLLGLRRRAGVNGR